MTMQEHLEREINAVLTTATTALALSEKLFSPAGLFSQLARTKEQRSRVVSSPLFKQAQHRFRELQYQEAQAFAQAVHHANAKLPAGEHRLKVKP